MAEEKNGHRDTDHIHPSEMASENWCPRATWYKITGEEISDPDRVTFQRLNIFAEGDTIHEKYQNLLHRAGILIGMWKCLVCGNKWWDKSPASCNCGSTLIKYAEVPLSDPAHRIMGNADGLCEDDDGEWLLEIKSVGLGTVRYDAPNLHAAYANGTISLDELWKRIKRPLAAHNRQIQLYMNTTGIHDAIVLYEWKPNQEVREFAVKFDPDVVKPMLDKCDAIIQAIEDETPPPKPEAAVNKSCNLCQYCDYKSTCWAKK